jgi:hypothetical protein
MKKRIRKEKTKKKKKIEKHEYFATSKQRGNEKIESFQLHVALMLI